jgi:hypothetical protein
MRNVHPQKGERTMRVSRLALVGLAGLGFALALAGPANAATAGASGADVVPAGTTTTLVLTAERPAGSDEPQTQASKRREWKGGAAYDLDSGEWRAYVTDGKQTAVFGSYDSREEAEANGQAQADAMNGKFVDAPECIPPILC